MKIYLIYGIIICSLLFTAGMRGYGVSNLFQSATWGPQGQSQYHK